MVDQQEMMAKWLDTLADRIAKDLKGSVAAAVEREINQSLSRVLAEGEFHRRLGQELQTGLKEIYKELAQVRSEQGTAEGLPAELLSEATDQLDQVLKTTERATVEIMEIVEVNMDRAAKDEEDLARLSGMMDSGAAEVLASLAQGNAALSGDLLKIMTTLSFQDLTGQRIARIFDALRRVEKLTVDLMVNAGIKLKAKAENPEMDLNQLQAQAEATVSDLKGPQSGTSQANVDSLLAELGL